MLSHFIFDDFFRGIAVVASHSLLSFYGLTNRFLYKFQVFIENEHQSAVHHLSRKNAVPKLPWLICSHPTYSHTLYHLIECIICRIRGSHSIFVSEPIIATCEIQKTFLVFTSCRFLVFTDSFQFQQNHSFSGVKEASIFAVSCCEFLLIGNELDANGSVSGFYMKGELRLNSLLIGPLTRLSPLCGDVFTISNLLINTSTINMHQLLYLNPTLNTHLLTFTRQCFY